jgi:hypothetical protein
LREQRLASARRSDMVRTLASGPARRAGSAHQARPLASPVTPHAGLGTGWGASETIRRPMEPAGPGGRHDGSARTRSVRAQGSARAAAERRDTPAAGVRAARIAGRRELWPCAGTSRRTPADRGGGPAPAPGATAAAKNLPSRFPACKVTAPASTAASSRAKWRIHIQRHGVSSLSRLNGSQLSSSLNSF